MDTRSTSLNIFRRPHANSRATRALRRAAEIQAARRTLESAAKSSDRRSYLSPGALEKWALLLTAPGWRPEEYHAFFSDALRTAGRYQVEVLRRADADVREATSAESEIERCIGSGVPFATLAAMLELAAKIDPLLAERLLGDTCEVAEWPIIAYLDRTLPVAAARLLATVARGGAHRAFTRSALRWLEKVGTRPK